MRYLLLLYGEPVRPETLTPERWKSVAAAHADFTRELTEAGALVDSAPLVTDGPFAETKEVLGGYYVIEAESLDGAVAWASRLRDDGEGSIEVRPVLQLPVDSGASGSS